MVKLDEKEFAINILLAFNCVSVRDIIAHSPINKKRAYYLLEKWSNKGYYDYGVSIDLGWLTEKGIEKFKKYLE
ncbi:MAG: hypothetical protein ACOCQA_03995 [bacterium]